MVTLSLAVAGARVVEVSAVGLILIIGGLIVIAFEFVHPGAFLLIPGTVVLASGVIFLVAPAALSSSPIGPLVVALVAVAAALITIPWYRRMGAVHRPMTTTPESLTGERGLVIAPVVPDQLSGKVRIHSEVWSARSDLAIPSGTRVRVVAGEGVCVIVAPVESAKSA